MIEGVIDLIGLSLGYGIVNRVYLWNDDDSNLNNRQYGKFYTGVVQILGSIESEYEYHWTNNKGEISKSGYFN